MHQRGNHQQQGPPPQALQVVAHPQRPQQILAPPLALGIGELVAHTAVPGGDEALHLAARPIVQRDGRPLGQAPGRVLLADIGAYPAGHHHPAAGIIASKGGHRPHDLAPRLRTGHLIQPVEQQQNIAGFKFIMHGSGQFRRTLVAADPLGDFVPEIGGAPAGRTILGQPAGKGQQRQKDRQQASQLRRIPARHLRLQRDGFIQRGPGQDEREMA